MPNSPFVNFNFTNNNVEVNTPSLGVTHVVARTTKGKPFSPDMVISSLAQFKQYFGEEVHESGLSNIETALKGGSKLRISRVLGSGYSKGYAQLATDTSGTIVGSGVATNQCSLILRNAVGSSYQYVYFKFESKEYDTPFTDSGQTELGVKVTREVIGGLVNVFANIYTTKVVASMTSANLLSKSLIFKYKAGAGGFVDVQSLKDFNNANNYVNLVFSHASTAFGMDNLINTINSIDKAYELINGWNGTIYSVNGVSGAILDDDADFYYTIFVAGEAGETIADTDWTLGYWALKDYSDGYNLIFSHLYDSLDSVDSLALLKTVKEDLDLINETRLFVEVPIYNSDGTVKEESDIADWVSTAIGTIGNSKYVAYFAGGYKYYNTSGTLLDCDNLGTVIGLADSSSSNFGPWLQFSGQNRGLVLNAKGPVSPNYGSPANYDKLNTIAKAMCNMSVIKDVPSYGMKTVLVHNFTSHQKTDSFRFLGVVGLCLFIKKTLRPILEKYLEEPNTFSTWKRMFHQVEPIMKALKEKDAITEFNYYGDQDATSYAQLQINNEADVRQGKYKVKLTFKEVVGLQEISMDLILDAATGSATLSFN